MNAPILKGMSNGKFLLGFLVFYFIISFSAWHFGGIRISGDAIGYFQIAENLQAGNGFSRCDSPPYLPDSSRTPVYPLFVLFFRQVFGGHFSLLAIVLAQAFVAGATLIIIKKALESMSLPLMPHATAAAVAFFGVSPTFIDAIITAYAEILLLFLLAVLLLLLVKILGDGSRKSALLKAALIGVVLGIMTLTKPVCQFLPVIPVAILAVKKRMKECGLILAGFLLVIIPWVWRNHSVFGKADISSIDEFNLCVFTARPLIGPVEYQDYQRQAGILENADNQLINAAKIGYFNFSLGARYKACGLTIIKDHWKQYVGKALVNLIDFPLRRGSNIVTRVLNIDSKKYRGLPMEARLRDPTSLAVIVGAAGEMLYRVLFYIFCLLGITLVFRSRPFFSNASLVLALLTGVYFIFLVSVTQIDDFDQARLILPGHLALTFFLPFGIGFMVKRIKTRREAA